MNGGIPLQVRAQAVLELRRRQVSADPDHARRQSWEWWLRDLYPAYVSAGFAPRHEQLWQWIDSIELGIRPRPFIGIWPRGGAKSTSAELGTVRLGARRARRYTWYISSTQDKADRHVETIAALLEAPSLGRVDGALSSRQLGKYGNSKGWRRQRLRTSSGMTVDALGLDTGARGAKIEDQRPDLMIFDDVDEKHDSAAATLKKIETITTSLLPAGSNDCAVLFIQNMIAPDSIAARLVDGRADFLADRVVSGPFPAVEGLTVTQAGGRFIITGGLATWEGQNLSVCQDQITTWGYTAFLQEAQHEVDRPGGIWDHIEFQHCPAAAVPWAEMIRGCVWVDPAVTSTDNSDCMGIVADAIASNKKIYRLFAWEGITSPVQAIARAILVALQYKFAYVGIETDQGGDTWRSVFRDACNTLLNDPAHPEITPATQFPRFAWAKAGAGYGSKMERNQRMLSDYERGQVVHVEGTHQTLERALRRFPGDPLDLADAAFWGWNDLRNGGSGFENAQELGKVEGDSPSKRWG